MLQSAGVRVWLDGGWSVDALLGEQTRPHADLDLAVPADHQLRRHLLGARLASSPRRSRAARSRHPPRRAGVRGRPRSRRRSLHRLVGRAQSGAPPQEHGHPRAVTVLHVQVDGAGAGRPNAGRVLGELVRVTGSAECSRGWRAPLRHAFSSIDRCSQQVWSRRTTAARHLRAVRDVNAPRRGAQCQHLRRTDQHHRQRAARVHGRVRAGGRRSSRRPHRAAAEPHTNAAVTSSRQAPAGSDDGHQPLRARWASR